jgi:hypothetical protein
MASNLMAIREGSGCCLLRSICLGLCILEGGSAYHILRQVALRHEVTLVT